MATGTETSTMPTTEPTAACTHSASQSSAPQIDNEGYDLTALPTPGRGRDYSAPGATGNPKPDLRGPRFIPRDMADTSLETVKAGTEVDVVLVPCPGADPLRTWIGDMKRRHPGWAFDGIRHQAPLARVMMYDHGDVKEAWSLRNLATGLLRLLFEERSLRGQGPYTDLKQNTRPLFFICHSIGGLVVKLALTEAYRHRLYGSIMESCHGVTFFATPHHGSYHLFMDDFKFSIEKLLNLRAPLPSGLTRDLSPNDCTLQKIDETFKQVAGELKLWTFYETEDSLLSSISPTTGLTEAKYTAPITPMRSAILGVRHEKIYALRSTHADCAWFEEDYHIQRLYLRSFGSTVQKAGWVHKEYPSNTLHSEALETEVMVEVHGFYENKMLAKVRPAFRMLFIKHSLERFLAWGPDALLDERLFNRQPMGDSHDLMADRVSLWRDPGLDIGVLLSSDSSTARRQYQGQKDPGPSPTSTQNGGKALRLALSQRLSSIAEDPQIPDEPRSEDKKISWIHVPFNNPVWVRKVFETLSGHDATDYDELFGAPHWGSRHTRSRHPQHHACFLKPTCGTVSFRDAPSQDCRYLYLPYLHFDSYKAVIKRRRVITQRLEQGRTNPVAAWVLEGKSLEFKVMWAFLGHDPPVNCRRTLDQYQYPSIQDTRDRDDDQILYKLTRERLPASGPTVGAYTEDDDVLNGTLLMVDQLWMWVMETPDHKSRLFTFYPRRDGSPAEGPIFGQADLRDITYGDLNAGLAQQCTTASDLAALTILNAVTALIDRSTDPDLDVFRIFEEAVSILTETMTSSLKRFGMSAFSREHKYQSIQVMESLSIRDRHRLEVERAREESRNSTSTLLELRDVEEELKSLLNLFSEQQDHVKTFLEISEAKVVEDETASQRASGVSLTTNGRYFLIEALEKLKAYKLQVQDMINRVEKAIRDFDRLLEIVQKQSQLEEGFVSRHQADLTKVQNRSVIIFTVFSVIFLPLSFFTSVFGMNTREWGGGDNLSLSTIVSIGIPISVTLIAGTVIAAWVIAEGAGYGHARRWVKKRGLHKMIPVALRRRQKARKKTRIMRQQRGEIFNPDFWERHRSKKNRGYEIPLGNRKNATFERSRKMAAGAKEDSDIEAVEHSEDSVSDY